MEELRLIVREEGRSARNLIAFNVPVTSSDSGKVTRKPPTSPRPTSELSTSSSSSFSTTTRKSERTTQSDGKKHGSRVRSASTGRDKKSELQARYWAFLLGNLQRAIDELYCACEAGECIAQCQEVVLVLDNYTRDFHALIQWFRVKWRYEATTPPQRPQALAWDIRKSSPPGAKLFRSSAANLSPKSDKMVYDQPRTSETPTPPMSTPTHTGAITSESSSPPPLETLSIGLLKTVEVAVAVAVEPPPSPAPPTDEPPPPEEVDAPVVAEEPKPMTHQASQTDLELCIQDKDCIRFLPAPQADAETTQTPSIDVSSNQTMTTTTATATTSTSTSPPKLVRSRTVTEIRRTSARPTLTRSSTSLRNAPVSRQRVPRPHTELWKNTKAQASTSFNKRQPGFPANTQPAWPNQEPNGSSGGGGGGGGGGSTTSLNSSGSWADRVRRKSTSYTFSLASSASTRRYTHQVESRRNISSHHQAGQQQQQQLQLQPRPPDRRREQSSTTQSATSQPKEAGAGGSGDGDPPASVSVEVLTDDDSQGWSTVKGRSRWRGAVAATATSPSHSQSSARLRYQQPTAAVSLPALALAEVALRPPPPPPKDNNANPINKSRTKASFPAFPHLKPPQRQQQAKPTNRSSATTTATATRRPASAEIIRPNRNNNSIKEKAATNPITLPNKDSKTEEDEIIPSERIEEGLSSMSLDILDSNLTGDELLRSEALIAEEAKLQEEIHALESAEIEGDTETDETETDGEATVAGDESVLRKISSHLSDVCLEEEEEEEAPPSSLDNLENRYEKMLVGLSWADCITALKELQALEARHPGRAQELHQKLSSPSRRRGGGPITLTDALKRFQEKQAHAKAKRESLKQARSLRLRELLNKVEEVKAAQALLVETRRERLEEKLRRAEENRNHHLREIVKKAHDEDEKAKEIAFINELEAQNKRHDLMAQSQEHDQRVHGLQESRQRRHEAQAAKEAAFEERRRRLAYERQQRIERMQEKRRNREERVGRIQQEKEKERQEAAREKARDREERRSALQAAQLATQSELQKKIQQKQVDTARRHEESLEHIRQRALESSLLRVDDGAVTPRLTPYDTVKLCKLCNVLIGSEVYLLSHVRGRKHHEAVQAASGLPPSPLGVTDQAAFDLKHIVDAPADTAAADPRLALDKERQQALRKRCKKIRIRMNLRAQDLESKLQPPPPAKVDSQHKGRLHKCLKDVNKLLVQNKLTSSSAQTTTLPELDRTLGELNRILAKQNTLDQLAFLSLGGFTTLGNLLSLALENPVINNSQNSLVLPSKSVVSCCSAFRLACVANQHNSRYVLCTQNITTILDVLVQHLAVRRNTGSAINKPDAPDAVAEALLRLATLVISLGGDESSKKEDSDTKSSPVGPGGDSKEFRDVLWVRRQDVISYTVAVGVVDRLATHCAAVQDPIDSEPAIANFLLAGLEFLTALADNSCLPRVGVGASGGSGEQQQQQHRVDRGDRGDPTQLVPTLRVTELVGAVSMLYGMVLHQGAPPRGNSPEDLAPHAIAVCLATFRLLAASAKLDLQMFQFVLGSEGISLQFRHIASHLVWFCSKMETQDELLDDLIRVVGYFAVGNTDNQIMLQSGSQPTVLQQLLQLPFTYFSQPLKKAVLLPTLLACCHGNARNRAVLEEELSYQMLEDFASSEEGLSDRLVSLVRDTEA